jgi:DNA mismatch endonuclease (patch repair protein)
MTDVLTRKQRSYNMSRIRAKNTGPEIMVRRHLIRNGIRGYRLHSKLPGRPDIVFGQKKTAIFIDGCFWHQCPRCFVRPATNRKFWDTKIKSNIARDRKNTATLRKIGWKVLRFWEHQIRRNPEAVTERIIRILQKR